MFVVDLRAAAVYGLNEKLDLMLLLMVIVVAITNVLVYRLIISFPIISSHVGV